MPVFRLIFKLLKVPFTRKECHLRTNLRLELKHTPLQNTPNEKLGPMYRKYNSCLSYTYAELIFRCDHKIAKSDYEFRHVCLPVRLSAWNNSAPTQNIFIKFGICIFFESLSTNSSPIEIRRE